MKNSMKKIKQKQTKIPCELTFGKFSRGTRCITDVLPRGSCKTVKKKF